MSTRILLFIFSMLLSVAYGEGITAQLSSPSAEAGQGVVLTLRVDGSPDRPPQLPTVKNLIVNTRGTSQNMSFINGKMSRSVAYNYAIGSNQPGEYLIPAIKVKINGMEYQTQPLKLTVRASANAVPQGMEDGDDTATKPQSDFGFVEFQMLANERKHIYPGEIVPVRIKAYFPMNTRINLRGNPRPDGSAFTLHNLSDRPQQGREQIDGKVYTVVTWFGGLSATKAGKYPANFVVDVTAQVPDPNAMPVRRPRPGPFNDPFFDNNFADMFQQMIEKDVTLKCQNSPVVEVRELPTQGKPEGFTGAIGEFAFEAVNVPRAMGTGEPVQLSARVKGSGNFALLGQPTPLPADEWKTYAGKDDFQPTDIAAFSGAKSFEFSAVPLVPGYKELRLGFSYFDPNKGEYIEVKSEPFQVNITGESKLHEKAEPETKPEVVKTPTGPQLAPLSEKTGPVCSYRAITHEPWFAPVAAGSGLLTLCFIAAGIWRERREDPERIARLEARAREAHALHMAETAAKQHDVPGFFSAARDVLRMRVAKDAPNAVTLDEISNELSENARELWRVADRIDYSGQEAPAAELPHWLDVLKSELQTIPAKGAAHE